MDALVGGLEEIRDLEKPCPLVYSSHMSTRRTVEDKSQLHKSPILNINHFLTIRWFYYIPVVSPK